MQYFHFSFYYSPLCLLKIFSVEILDTIFVVKGAIELNDDNQVGRGDADDAQDRAPFDNEEVGGQKFRRVNLREIRQLRQLRPAVGRTIEIFFQFVAYATYFCSFGRGVVAA